MSWKCNKCDRTLKNANQWHCCVNQDIDSLFENKQGELVYAFDRILSFVDDLKSVEISATKNCVVFFKTQTFLVIKPMKTLLNVKFYLQEPFKEHPVFKTALYGKQHEHHIRISTMEEANETLFKFIKQSHDLFNNDK
jgi:Domain of unknown function (DUF5655)